MTSSLAKSLILSRLARCPVNSPSPGCASSMVTRVRVAQGMVLQGTPNGLIQNSNPISIVTAIPTFDNSI